MGYMLVMPSVKHLSVSTMNPGVIGTWMSGIKSTGKETCKFGSNRPTEPCCMGSTTCTQLPPFAEHRGHDGETAARRNSVRVVRHLAWLEVGAGKAALSRTAHQYPANLHRSKMQAVS